MKTGKKIIVVMTILLGAMGSYGWYLYNKKPVDVRTARADLAITSKDLLQAFLRDEAAANRTYVGKVIVVKGRVANTQKDSAGRITLVIETGDPLASVVCSFYTSEADAAANINSGTTIQVKGQCTGILTDIILNKCSIVHSQE
jgi:tRNA_anti-like